MSTAAWYRLALLTRGWVDDAEELILVGGDERVAFRQHVRRQSAGLLGERFPVDRRFRAGLGMLGEVLNDVEEDRVARRGDPLQRGAIGRQSRKLRSQALHDGELAVGELQLRR